MLRSVDTAFVTLRKTPRSYGALSLSFMQKVLEGEGATEESVPPKPRVDVQSLNTRAYLDHTVVPIILDAMAAVARERSD